jgi:general secretion pathway protein G
MQNTIDRLRRRQSILKDREGGFTLIELLIVIVILAILAAIIVFAVQNLTGSSAQASCKSDFKTVEVAAEAYKAQVGVYPGDTLPAGSTAATTVTTGTSPGINALLGSVNVPGSSTAVGPWIKSNPLNANHYQIKYTTAGTAGSQVPTEQVWNTATGTGAATVPATGTGTIADCSSVS